MNDEDDANESERAQADALARALDGEAGAQPPEDALQAALFLRHGGARGELAPDRAEAILQDLLRDTPLARPQRPRARVLRLWPIGAAMAAAAAAVLLWLSPPEQKSAPASGVTAALPAVSTGLLAAQADLLRHGTAPHAQDAAEAAQRFDRELRAYRAQVFRALEAAYSGTAPALRGGASIPAPVGMLEPRRRTR